MGKLQGGGSEVASLNIFPQQIGKYRMQRTWSEQDWLGGLAYRWAAYLQESSADEVDVALWLGPGVHYPIACHVSKGERPAWQQVNTLPTAQGGSATFALYFYEQSNNRALEATTVCDAGGCNENEQVLLSSQTAVTIASMGMKNLLFHPTSTPLPILIRTQSHELSGTSEDAKERMLRDLQDFISGLNTYALAGFAQSRNR
jgi:exosortase J